MTLIAYENELKKSTFVKEEKDDVATYLCRSLVFSPAKPSRSLQNIFVYIFVHSPPKISDIEC